MRAIYGRALVAGNFTHAGAATLVLLRPTIASGSPKLWSALVVALVVAIGLDGFSSQATVSAREGGRYEISRENAH